MSYNVIAVMAHDPYIRLRITACAAEQGHPGPSWWADQNIWAVVASPGWAESYKYAMDLAKIPLPDLAGHDAIFLELGKDESVITDATILATVQPMLAEQGQSAVIE